LYDFFGALQTKIVARMQYLPLPHWWRTALLASGAPTAVRAERAERTRNNVRPRSLRRCTRRYTAQRAVFHHAIVTEILPNHT